MTRSVENGKAMIRDLPVLLLPLFLGVAMITSAQQGGEAPKGTDNASPPGKPAANPGRPTVSTPATLTPVGYLQFETGFLGAWNSPEFSSQSSLNEVMKFSIVRRIELLAGAGTVSPFPLRKPSFKWDGGRVVGGPRGSPSRGRRWTDNCVELLPPSLQWRHTRPRYR
jgi:hypothetical protein